MTASIQDTTKRPWAVDDGRARIESLYVHVPFCIHKCHYCDFYSIVDRPRPAPGADTQEAFTQALITEFEHEAGGAGLAGATLEPRTIFVGGGTPTFLRAPLWRDLLKAFRGAGVLEQVVEFTVEANPETVTRELADALVAGGVNRISLGAQTFHKPLLATLERRHDPLSTARAVRVFRDAGIENLNLDLIFAIPGQSPEMLDADLDSCLGLRPEHVSCYSLTYEPDTPMTKRLRLGLIEAAPEELERHMYRRIGQRLDDAGFEHYEISSWSLPPDGPDTAADGRRAPRVGRRAEPAAGASPLRCAHNVNYWTNGNWLGIGPGAASHVDGHRWKNEPHLGRYISESPRPPVVDDERLPPPRRVGEQLMLGLRLRDGVCWDRVEEQLQAQDGRRDTIKELVALNMLEHAAGRLRLTDRGLDVADSVIANLL